jgi:hypothetical protein
MAQAAHVQLGEETMQLKIVDGVTRPANLDEIISAVKAVADDEFAPGKPMDLAIMSPDGPLCCAIRVVGIHAYMAAGQTIEGFGYYDTDEALTVQHVTFDSVFRLKPN